eukprot:TRINITY_DN48353_c0_g1_i1.p1 TRINITY_DN48353_c0_g1~~TRINITY_DN48353_c0_g1_i1.p1  ORF type:complete len:256 (-),score=41.34 TRINITY_DN48353_c0_g1_i1:46-813(-)
MDPERDHLLAEIARRDDEIRRLSPELQQLRQDFRAMQANYNQRSAAVEEKLRNCRMMADDGAGNLWASTDKTRATLYYDLERQRQQQEILLQEKEKRLRREEAGEETFWERISADCRSLVPIAPQRADVSTLLKGPAAAQERRKKAAVAQRVHIEENLPPGRGEFWDPTVPPGGRVVEVRIWDGDPSPRTAAASQSLHVTRAMCPQFDQQLKNTWAADHPPVFVEPPNVKPRLTPEMLVRSVGSDGVPLPTWVRR